MGYLFQRNILALSFSIMSENSKTISRPKKYFFGKAFFTLFLFSKKKTCAKRKNISFGKAFLSKKRFMIAIIDYGMGNLFSIYNGLKKVYDRSMLITADNITDMRAAEGVIVPGVGAFDDGIRNLEPFSEALIEVVESGMPVLGICIGMQVLFEASEEGKEKGWGLIPGEVVRLPANVRVPHMGWNNLHLQRDSELLNGITEADYFYFVHSYYCVPRDEDATVASVEYGVELAAVVNKDNVYGVQFHPEKSSKKGLQVLSNFVGVCK
jgi:glutamine amidotransferase